MSAVALGSNSTILLGDRVTVGVEGAASARAAVTNAGTGSVSISADTRLAGDVWSRGNVTFIGERGQVAGSITTAGTVTRQNGVVIGGPVLEHQTLSTVPTSWTITFPSSSTNVMLQPGQAQTLAPGPYATVSVASNATLTLATGTYYFDQLTNEPQGKILLTGSGPFLIYVRTKFMVKGPVVLPAASPPPALLVGVAGTMDVFIQTDLDGTIVAPNANVTLAAIGTGVYQGAYFGKSLTLQADVKVERRGASVGTVVPVAECVIPEANGTYTAVFGYLASSVAGNVTIPIGVANQFTPGSANRGQPQVFAPGRQRAQFKVPFDGKALAWVLNGRSSTANAALPQCTPACVQHLVDTSKPRISAPLSTPAPPLSVDESAVMADTFRWEDTLPVPETFSDGTPRIYHSIVYVTSRESLQTLDLFRIHYSTTPLFDQEWSSLEQQGIQTTFFFPHDGRGQFVYALIPGPIYNRIRQAALDPAEPVEIFRTLAIRPIPTSDLGFTARSSCGLAPITACVAQAANGSLRAVFSYNNPAGNPVTIPVGADNAITGGPAGTLPPEAFATGQHNAVIAVSIPSGATVRWTLNGQTASASAATPRCSAAVVAQIGVDSYNPFPVAATPSCRFATRAEAQFPTSRLPPAARANSCTSVAYSLFGRLGLKWRGVDSEAEDVAGQAADAVFALGNTSSAASTSTASGGNQVVRSALFGKILRKAVQGVSGVVTGVVDGARRGLRAVAGLFVGTTAVDITIYPQYTDPSFAPGTMVQAWGAGFGNAISLQGLQLRANRSVFLSVGDLDANNHARVQILNTQIGAHICLRARNGAAFATSGFNPDDACIGSVGTSIPSVPLPTGSSPHVNVMAQMTDAQLYMTRVARFTPARAEVLMGFPANTIGRFNNDRGFAPCFSFSWANDVQAFLTALGAVLADRASEWAVNGIRDGVRRAARGVNDSVPGLASALERAQVIAGAASGNDILRPLADDAAAKVSEALARTAQAAKELTILSQDAEDLVNALNMTTAATAGTLDAARSQQLQRALDELNGYFPLATSTVPTARAALGAAVTAVDLLRAALESENSPLRESVSILLTSVTGPFSTVQNTLAILDVAGPRIAQVVALGVAELILNSPLGGIRLLGEVFELFAGADIVLPALSSGVTNATDRGIPTHEYGHFALCNLMNSVSPGQFAVAYNEAAAQGILGQNLNAPAAIVNESFADFITSQVVGGTNYAQPPAPVLITTSINYCLAAPTPLAAAGACIENNIGSTNLSATTFNGAVLRNVSLFVDAFDDPIIAGVIDRPLNGDQWQGTVGTIQIRTPPGQAANDEIVSLRDGQTSWLRRWVERTLTRGTLLREDNVFAGLSDAMTDHGYNWCARCEVFGLHTLDAMTMGAICPERWVGSRPMFSASGMMGPLTCIFEGCPTGTTPDPTTRICTPPCPTNEHFDARTLTCVPDIIVP